MYAKFLAGLAVAGGLLQAGEPRLLNNNMLAALRAEAARTHPSVAAAKHRAEAAALDVRGVRLWNDPMVGLGLMAAEQSMRTDLGDLIVGVEQTLPKPGMYAAKRLKAEALHRAEMASATAAALTASATAARDAIELALADESITLQQAQVTWLAAMAENARQHLADPTGTSLDALRMETALVKETQVLEAVRRTRDGVARKLNLTLGRPVDTAWPALKLPATPPPVPLAPAEIARIPYANPKVRVLREMAGAASQDTRIANRERLPAVSVGIDTSVYSGGDWRSTTLGVKMSLPWFNDRSYQANIAAARSRELAANREVETLRREIATEVLTSATEAANAAAQARAYGGEIQAKALQANQAIEAAWLSSKVPLTELLDASRMLFSIRLEQRRFTAMQLAAIEQLHALVPNR
ncbi:MAG: TolC family protein [Verrucomicrobia bacterium]|nr:TolC family protein [Verrucomicrobiota bacterium]